ARAAVPGAEEDPRARGRPVGRLAEEGLEARDGSRLRCGSAHRPRERPGRQQERCDRRALASAPLRLQAARPLSRVRPAWIVAPDAIRIAATRVGDRHGEPLEEDDVDDRVPRRRRSLPAARDRKSTRLNSSHLGNSYAVFCLKKKKIKFKEFTTNN